jgi:acyl carrier protein
LVAYVQETFGIHIEDDELIPENLDSVQKLVDFIARKREAEALKAS